MLPAYDFIIRLSANERKNDMEKSERCTEYFPIDAGAVVQLITGIKEQSPAFLIEYSTREMINSEKLRKAVQRALEVFRSFQVKPVLDEKSRKPVYQFNSAEADIYPYDGRPHFFGRESSGYLFRVYYTEKSIRSQNIVMIQQADIITCCHYQGAV